MSKICAIRNDRKRYSEAAGSLITILKVISELPESKDRQIIVDKRQLKEFLKKEKFGDLTLHEIKVFDCIAQSTLRGRMKRALGSGDKKMLEFYYLDLQGADH